MLVALEEYGLPLEVGKLFEEKLSTEGKLDNALSSLLYCSQMGSGRKRRLKPVKDRE